MLNLQIKSHSWKRYFCRVLHTALLLLGIATPIALPTKGTIILNCFTDLYVDDRFCTLVNAISLSIS